MPKALHLQRLQVSSRVTYTLRKAQLHNNLQTWSFPIIRFIGGSETTSFGAKDFTFSLWAVSNDTTIEREVSKDTSFYQTYGIATTWFWIVHLSSFVKVLIYPLVSLIADIGGTLGLFVGFSFMTIWDGVEVGGYRANDHAYCLSLTKVSLVKSRWSTISDPGGWFWTRNSLHHIVGKLVWPDTELIQMN